jgi:hypothetical protein
VRSGDSTSPALRGCSKWSKSSAEYTGAIVIRRRLNSLRSHWAERSVEPNSHCHPERSEGPMYFVRSTDAFRVSDNGPGCYASNLRDTTRESTNENQSPTMDRCPTRIILAA